MDELTRLLEALAEYESTTEDESADTRTDPTHRLDEVEKRIDDVLWHHRLDGADIRKLRLVGPPPANEAARTEQAHGNGVRFPAYVIAPEGASQSDTRPGLVFPHGGVHSNFSTNYYTPVIQELIDQGYVVIAPEYRGSTGYGQEHYELIDYGGLETEDTYETREWLATCEDRVDPDRIGIMGWSHGGLHTLMNVFDHPEAYQVAYAGVPVSDLIARMGYKDQEYRDLYEADHHIDTAAYEDPDEYRRRSPVWNAEKLETPLLIHTTTNDEDVNVLEVESLIRALKAAEKDFEYEIYEEAPGGHLFELLDTPLAVESRGKVYDFLATYLDPPAPMNG
ncbi:MAG: prolyl oligopeptidase family serine peptidase [Halobacteriales archaeon]|nr:prolyl oligopeptidase family serine peptidase [Halobacteriales archaeon]